MMANSVVARKEDISSLLKSVTLFTGVDDETRQAFAEAAVIKSIPKDKVLYIEGEEANYCYFIQEGWIKLFHETFDGTEAVMDILTKGHMFGEDSIFEGGEYSNHAQAVEDTILITFPTSLLKERIQSTPTLALNMFSSMSRYRKQQDMHIEHLAAQNASQRIGCFLLRLCPKGTQEKITLQLPYDKVLLASRLNMKPETFSRALNTLRDKTGIRVCGARVEIDSLDQLSEYACGICSSSYPCKDI